MVRLAVLPGALGWDVVVSATPAQFPFALDRSMTVVVVFDIEAVPDLEAARRLLAQPESTPDG
jgi:hypothetical protein